MQVFKFGGASVKDAEGVKNVARVMQLMGAEDKVMVVSAMGKNDQCFRTYYQIVF